MLVLFKIECGQKAYIKTVKGGTTDKADLICLKYKGDEDTYYKCLDGVYGNYIWMDRFTGASPCLCPSKDMPGQGQGALGADGKCWCGKTRPLKQRWQLDQNGEVVDRLHARLRIRNEMSRAVCKVVMKCMLLLS